MTTHRDGGGDRGVHLASIAHDGRLWTAFLEFQDDPHRPTSYRGCIRFEPADAAGDGEAARTAVIIIESAYEDAVSRARSFDDRQLVALLRSVLPGEDGADA